MQDIPFLLDSPFGIVFQVFYFEPKPFEVFLSLTLFGMWHYAYLYKFTDFWRK